MKILLSGSTGLVGQSLFLKLHKQGHDVVRLVRSVGDSAGNDLVWDPEKGLADKPRFDGFDAVIHLAGESIASGRWTKSKKKRIRDSRVLGTKNLSDLLASLNQPPKTFIVASAVGFYGNRGDQSLDETSPSGSGFLSEVCQEWESAAKPAIDKGIRTVQLRFGIILSPNGGALQKMLPPFKLGLGGVLGSGTQYMSWIALPDAVAIIEFALNSQALQGPVNAVSPEPVTNEVFTRTIGKVLVRPTYFPVPAFAARWVFGEMADALLLASARVLPKKLQQNGYAFKLPTLEVALRELLSR